MEAKYEGERITHQANQTKARSLVIGFCRDCNVLALYYQSEKIGKTKRAVAGEVARKNFSYSSYCSYHN